jgi:hypothetical protein
MSEKNKFDMLPYDEGPPDYESAAMPDIYESSREILYDDRPNLIIYLVLLVLPLTLFWWIWLAGKWLVQRFRQ